MKYIALLRGINVGGNNIIKMADLRTCFEQAGFSDVSTYIQSGNVLFSIKQTSIEKLEAKIESLLRETFSYSGMVVVISAKTLADIIAEAPRGFGNEPDVYRSDVIFMKRPLTASAAAPNIPTKESVDTVIAGPHAIYTTRLIAKAGSSKLSKITSLREYQSFTIRNWNTTTKLLALTANQKK